MKTLFQSKMSSFPVIAVSVFLWLGCANISQVENAPDDSIQQMETLREQSATQVPCPSYAIQIMPSYRINKSDGSASWTAVCFGDVYKCTRGGKDNQDLTCEQTEPQPVK
jgi:hypothetical protein